MGSKRKIGILTFSDGRESVHKEVEPVNREFQAVIVGSFFSASINLTAFHIDVFLQRKYRTYWWLDAVFPLPIKHKALPEQWHSV